MIRCPVCKKEAAPGSLDFPFCSERCRIIDLGNWASEKYKITTPAKSPEMPPDDELESE